MNNPFGDSRQRFSIRKFTVGVASVLLSSAVFGVSTANAEQAKEPTGQPATSVLEEANESDGGNPVELGETTNDAKGEIVISFDNIVYDKPGVYYYTVEEVKGNEADGGLR